MYLGWPKAASSWLANEFKKNNAVFLDSKKENHLWYTDAKKALDCFNSTSGDIIVDFSTNNWSMDLHVAKTVAELFDYFILMHRDPAEIVSSYHLMNRNNTWEQWQSTCLYNKICNSGDILERWANIVDEKLIVCEYKNLTNNNQKFLDKLFFQVDLKTKSSAGSIRLNQSKQPHLKVNNQDLIELIQHQENKFYKIIKEKSIEIF